jgi:hypothetical protein
MIKKWSLYVLMMFVITAVNAQQKKSLFKVYKMSDIPGSYFGEILIMKEGPILVSASEFSFSIITGGNVGVFTMGLENQDYGIKNIKSVFTGTPLKNPVESADENIFFTTEKDQVTYFKFSDSGICDLPPFYFPPKKDSEKNITGLWFDKENNLYIGTTDSVFYIVSKAGSNETLNPAKYKIAAGNDSSMLILNGEVPVKKINIGAGIGIYSFAEDRTNRNIIWLGTGKGLDIFDKNTGTTSDMFSYDSSLTITHIEPFSNGDVWFSTLEKGMGIYHQLNKSYEFFPYPKKTAMAKSLYPIQNFCIKSSADFFVAVKDSTPAIFNIAKRSYRFLNDSSFAISPNTTTDIKQDSAGNFYFIKGGMLFSANVYDKSEWLGAEKSELNYTPLIFGVTDFNDKEITSYLTKPELLKKLTLGFNENSIKIYITSNSFSGNKKMRYAWKLKGDVNNWVEMPAFNNDTSNIVELPDIKPGNYVFSVRMKPENGDWSKNEAQMEIIIMPPYWATAWFWAIVVSSFLLIFFIITKLRINAIKKRERLKTRYEKELLELEAKALRAQMNPHFIFNCMNSIKALMQQNDMDRGIGYLTTFSKLLRTIFQNSDKREVTLYDEIETCKLYTQLESMRFGKKFNYHFNIDETIDLKSIMVPALIIQPFIENAIWHGIMPKEDDGSLTVSISRNEDKIACIIDDNGIGREMSKQYKFKGEQSTHQSKGVHLTQSRLDLDNSLNQRNAALEIIDKKDDEGKSLGTKIILTFLEL